MWVIVDEHGQSVTGGTPENAWASYGAETDTYDLNGVSFYDLSHIKPIKMKEVLIPLPDTE